jgi:hypothetical protein
MAAAGRAGSRPHGMLSVVGLPDGELEGICREAAEKLGPGTVCVVANYLFPTVRAQPAARLVPEMRQIANCSGRKPPPLCSHQLSAFLWMSA